MSTRCPLCKGVLRCKLRFDAMTELRFRCEGCEFPVDVKHRDADAFLFSMLGLFTTLLDEVSKREQKEKDDFLNDPMGSLMRMLLTRREE